MKTRLAMVCGVVCLFGCVDRGAQREPVDFRARDERIDQKLKATVVPEIYWVGMDAWHALAILGANLQGLDVGDGKPLDVVLPVKGSVNLETRIRCHATDITLFDAMKMVAHLAGAEAAVTNGCVVVRIREPWEG